MPCYNILEEWERNSPPPRGVRVSWEEVVVGPKKGEKVILNNLSGSAGPGQLVAIMGSSGAGKSTLMNILSRRNISELKYSGKVTFNGRTVGNAVNKISAYIQQEDIFIGSMTVQEHLYFHAKLRLRTNPVANRSLKFSRF